MNHSATTSTSSTSPMARFAAVILLTLLGTVSGYSFISYEKGENCRYYGQVPGGCPNIIRCMETCRPCYRGTGFIQAECEAPGGFIHFWECRCYFQDGAPFPPPAPGPTCPKPPGMADHLNHNQAHWAILSPTRAVYDPIGTYILGLMMGVLAMLNM